MDKKYRKSCEDFKNFVLEFFKIYPKIPLKYADVKGYSIDQSNKKKSPELRIFRAKFFEYFIQKVKVSHEHGGPSSIN